MRIIACIALLVLLTFVPIAVAAGLLLLYGLVWAGMEMLLVAIIIDSFFGLSAPYPLYTLLAGGVLLTITWLKPHLSVYNEWHV